MYLQESILPTQPASHYSSNNSAVNIAESVGKLLKSSDIPNGLQNYGNTCFMNVILQSLANCDSLYTLFQQEYKRVHHLAVSSSSSSSSQPSQWKIGCKKDSTCLLCLLEKTILMIRSPNNTSAINDSIKSVLDSFPLFPMKLLTKGRQEDCHEFLMNVLFAFQLNEEEEQEEVEEEEVASKGINEDKFIDGTEKITGKNRVSSFYRKRKEPSPHDTFLHHTNLERLFQGRIQQEIECQRCYRVSTREESIIDIAVDIQYSSALETSLQDYLKVVEFKGNNCYDCSNCQQKTLAKQYLQILSLPKILCIQLKRFYLDSSHELRKIKHFVTFPVELSFPTLVNTKNQDQQKVNIPDEEYYELKSVIVHKGETMNNGHYVCYLRRNQTEWFLADDTKIKAVSVDEVLDADAYLLFYEKTVKEEIVFKRAAPTTLKRKTSVAFQSASIPVSDPVSSSFSDLKNKKPGLLRTVSSRFNFFERLNLWKSKINEKEKWSQLQTLQQHKKQQKQHQLQSEKRSNTLAPAEALSAKVSFLEDPVVFHEMEGGKEMKGDTNPLEPEEVVNNGNSTESSRLSSSLVVPSRHESTNEMGIGGKVDRNSFEEEIADFNLTTSTLSPHITHRRGKRKRDTYNNELDKALNDFESRKHLEFISSPSEEQREAVNQVENGQNDSSPTKKQKREPYENGSGGLPSLLFSFPSRLAKNFTRWFAPDRKKPKNVQTVKPVTDDQSRISVSQEPTQTISKEIELSNRSSNGLNEDSSAWVTGQKQLARGIQSVFFGDFEEGTISNSNSNFAKSSSSIIWY